MYPNIIHHRFQLPPGDDNWFYYRVPMYSPQDAPSHSSPGNGQSFIKINRNESTKFISTVSMSQPIDVVVFHSSKSSGIGYKSTDGSHNFVCCTTEALQFVNCTQGEIILNEDERSPNNNNSSNLFWGWIQTTSLQQTQNVEVSGVYYFLIVNCKETETQLNGQLQFMNPYGHYNLDGDKLFTFSKIIESSILSLLEATTSYFDYLGFNNIGLNWGGAMITGKLASVFKRSVSRLVILGVSQGRGIIKGVWESSSSSTTTTTTSSSSSSSSLSASLFYRILWNIWGWMIGGGAKVIILTCIYFVSATFLASFELLRVVSDRSSRETLNNITMFLIWPVAILDAIFYWWILLSLFQTIAQLQAKKQMVKLWMYKKFLYLLMALGLCTAISMISEIVVRFTQGSLDYRWKYEWIWEGLWLIYYSVMLIFIAIIWRPNSDNTQYAYSELSQELSSDNEIALQPISVSFGEISKRNVKSDSQPSTIITTNLHEEQDPDAVDLKVD